MRKLAWLILVILIVIYTYTRLLIEGILTMEQVQYFYDQTNYWIIALSLAITGLLLLKFLISPKKQKGGGNGEGE